MVNILLLSNNPYLTRQLTSSLLRFAPDLKIRLARTLSEAENFCQRLRLRLAFVDRRLAAERIADVPEQLRREMVNRFLPIVMVGSADETGLASQAKPGISGSELATLGMSYHSLPIEPDDLKRLLEQVFVEWRSLDHRPSTRILLDQSGSARWVSEDDIVFVEYALRSLSR